MIKQSGPPQVTTPTAAKVRQVTEPMMERFNRERQYESSSAGQWRTWRVGDTTYKLLPPLPGLSGKLIVAGPGLNCVTPLQWEPTEVSKHAAGRCPVCWSQLVVRNFDDCSVRLRTAKLDRSLTPPNIGEDIPFGDPPTEEEIEIELIETGREYWYEEHPECDEPDWPLLAVPDGSDQD
jgi:hypothetical protein